MFVCAQSVTWRGASKQAQRIDVQWDVRTIYPNIHTFTTKTHQKSIQTGSHLNIGPLAQLLATLQHLLPTPFTAWLPKGFGAPLNPRPSPAHDTAVVALDASTPAATLPPTAPTFSLSHPSWSECTPTSTCTADVAPGSSPSHAAAAAAAAGTALTDVERAPAPDLAPLGPGPPDRPTAQLLPETAPAGPLRPPVGGGMRAAGACILPTSAAAAAAVSASASAAAALADTALPEGFLRPAGPPDGITEPCGYMQAGGGERSGGVFEPQP